MTRKPTPKSEPKPERSEYENFEDFARRIIAVPKPETDEERAKENGKKSDR